MWEAYIFILQNNLLRRPQTHFTTQTLIKSTWTPPLFIITDCLFPHSVPIFIVISCLFSFYCYFTCIFQHYCTYNCMRNGCKFYICSLFQNEIERHINDNTVINVYKANSNKFLHLTISSCAQKWSFIKYCVSSYEYSI